MMTLGIVPARAGSKRLPDKNLQPIDGLPLVTIAVQCGLDAGLDAVVVSTDSDLVWHEVGCIGGPGVPRIALRTRPPALATDEATSFDVVRDALTWAELNLGVKFDVTVLLQPTSPLREAADVEKALQVYRETGAAAVVSVTSALRSDWLFTLGHAGRLRPADRSPGVYMPNGAVYVLGAAAVRGGRDWWTVLNAYGFVMPPERSIDIDTQADLDEARRLWRLRAAGDAA